jgi:hypothetical protein
MNESNATSSCRAKRSVKTAAAFMMVAAAALTIWWLAICQEREAESGDDRTALAAIQRDTRASPDINGSRDPSKQTEQHPAIGPGVPSATSGTEPPQEITIKADGDQQPDPDSLERTQVIEVHLDSGGCEACRNRRGGQLMIPDNCKYLSHRLTQTERVPNVGIESPDDEATGFTDVVYRDSKGRIYGVQIILRTYKSRMATVQPSITMKLEVAASCKQSGSTGIPD